MADKLLFPLANYIGGALGLTSATGSQLINPIGGSIMPGANRIHQEEEKEEEEAFPG